MSAPLTISAELAASVQNMKARTWRDADAQAFEQGITPTKPAATGARTFNASRFTPRQRPRSPDRQASRDRRRRLGGSSALPDTLRHHYTEGQRAVLCIIAGEIRQRAACDLPIDKIAALAGVCRTTVQTTLHEARRLGHIRLTERPRRGQKNLTNVVEIVSAEWRAWIKRGVPAHRPIGSKSVNLASTTKTIHSQKGGSAQAARPEGAVRAPPEARCPPQTDSKAGGDISLGILY